MHEYCDDGNEHDIVNPEEERYNPTRLLRYNESYGPRPNILWTYCAKCGQGFRWSVPDQQWRPWPGGLALLPHMSDEELDELAVAVVRRMDELGKPVQVASATGTRAELHYKLRILSSLRTAVQEARYQLFPPAGAYEPRMWGEAWDDFERWAKEQRARFEAGKGQAAEGALLAFDGVLAKLDQMRAANSAGLMRRRQDEIGSSRPEPTSDDSK